MKVFENLSVEDAFENEEEKILHEKYMREAIKQAKKAAESGDVPIGCVIVSEGRIIARAYNKRNAMNTALGHAEIIAIKKACKKIGDWRLENTAMYITLEPCQMCAGAIIQSRIPEVYMGAMNPKAGCAGSIIDLLHVEKFNHAPYTVHGIMEEECKELLKDFFKNVRNNK